MSDAIYEMRIAQRFGLLLLSMLDQPVAVEEGPRTRITGTVESLEVLLRLLERLEASGLEIRHVHMRRLPG